jgi:hypothetical protein
MPKKHSTRAEQRKRFKLEAHRQGISLGELQKRLKPDGDTVGQEAGEGFWTIPDAGQDGAASGMSPIQDEVITPVNLLSTDAAVPKETGFAAEDGHSYAKVGARAKDGHSHQKIPTLLKQRARAEHREWELHAKIPPIFVQLGSRPGISHCNTEGGERRLIEER